MNAISYITSKLDGQSRPKKGTAFDSDGQRVYWDDELALRVAWKNPMIRPSEFPVFFRHEAVFEGRRVFLVTQQTSQTDKPTVHEFTPGPWLDKLRDLELRLKRLERKPRRSRRKS